MLGTSVLLIYQEEMKPPPLTIYLVRTLTLYHLRTQSVLFVLLSLIETTHPVSVHFISPNL